MPNPSHPSRPAVALAIFLAVGISLCNVLPCHPWIWFLAAAATVLLAALFHEKNALANLSIALAITFLGLLAAQIQRYQFPANNIAQYASSADRFAQVEFYLPETPRLISASTGVSRNLPPKQTARADITAIHTNDGWQPTSGKILLTLEQLNPNIAAGQTIRAIGMLQRPAPPNNPGEFDFAAWAADERISATLRISHADGAIIVRQSGFTPLVWLREKTRHLLAMGFSLDKSYDHALLQAFVLGDPDPQLTDLDEKFIQTGTVHCLTISGLHIAIIGSLVLLVCRLLRISPRHSLWAALVAVLIYGLIATPTWPGWRSILMVSAAAIALFNRRWPDGIQLFAVAVSAILFVHPADLHDGGFQVSFAAVLGMILFSNRATKHFWQWWRGPDSIALPPPARTVTTSAAAWLVKSLISILIAAAVAWLMSMPLVAYHFGQLNAWSVPAGVALLPLTILALLAGIAKILLTLAWPTTAHFWAMLCSLPILWMRDIIEKLDQFPGANIPMASPSIWFLVVYYGLFAAALIQFSRPALRYLSRLAPIAACAGLILWPLISRANVQTHFENSPPQIEITLISLGAGQCAVIRDASNHAILIDVGSDTVSDVRRSLLTPYLRSVGCTQVNRILLSHGDYDHISAAADIFQTYSEPPIDMSPHFRRHALNSETAEALLETLQSAHHPPEIIQQGDHLDLGDAITMDVLWPPRDCDMNSNNCGLVLKLNYAGRAVLFPADIQEPPERELLKNSKQLKSDILIAPHHGSAELTTAAFIKAVDPQIILASNASPLTHKQKVFDTIVTHDIFYRTSQYGAITVSIDADGKIAVTTFIKNEKIRNQFMNTSQTAR